MPDPFIKNGIEKLAILDRLHRPRGNLRRPVRIRRDQNEAIGGRYICNPFHNGDELHEAAPDFFQEAINL